MRRAEAGNPPDGASSFRKSRSSIGDWCVWAIPAQHIPAQSAALPPTQTPPIPPFRASPYRHFAWACPVDRTCAAF